MRRIRLAAEPRRAGYLTPALAMAVLTAFLISALVLNLGWRRAAERQIVVAADAAALAAAGELACDERLLDEPFPEETLQRIAGRADELARRHGIVGVDSQVAQDGMRMGRRVTDEDGRSHFLDTDFQPSAVAVSVQRGRDGKLPWLFRAGGNTAGTLAAIAEAAIDGRVAALRPRAGGTVPVWPLALRSGAAASDGGAAPAAGWRDQIEMKLGGDRYGYDRQMDQVVERPDGLPELVVTTLPGGGELDQVGVTLVDVGQSFGADRLDRALREGLRSDDLDLLGGEVPVSMLAQSPVDAEALPRLPIEAERNLRPGDSKALFLFETLSDDSGQFSARLNTVVVARLMELEPTGDGGWRATFQPAVLATGTAVLADAGGENETTNRYLYKVRLTR